LKWSCTSYGGPVLLCRHTLGKCGLHFRYSYS